jgi:hypothetical protein
VPGNRVQALVTQMRTVEVVAASYVQCNTGYRLGVVQVGNSCEAAERPISTKAVGDGNLPGWAS